MSSCHCKHSPVIVLPGINHSLTFLYDNENRPVNVDGALVGGTLLIPNKSALNKSTLFKLILRVLASAVTQTKSGLDKAAYNLVSDFLRYQRCDDFGNHVENLQTKRWNHSLAEMSVDELGWVYRMVPMKTLVDEIGEDHVYFFTFNLAGDPINSADDLDDYIEMVKAQTGHSKVTLLPISLGGTILTAYLEKYGHGNIDQIVNIVACLDGTDFVADFYARDWRLDDYYLYHRFLENVFIESDGAPTSGYIINTLLHIFPRKAVDALLSGAISAVLDTLMINCPQFWAMLPSYRYSFLAERYLSDKPVLKSRADAFQTARLNLSKNLLAAAADGVRVNSVACANLDLGEQMYTYFNIVASATKVNSDGIVNLSSASLGATGAHGNNTLDSIDYSGNKYCRNPEHNHISPDNKVDASTALFPENTWIFIGQHHEVGRNDVVLNLVKALILGEVTDVNSNPEKYPQYNGACYTQGIRRWKLPDAYKIDQTKLSFEEKSDLNDAIREAESVLSLTIADSQRAETAEQRLCSILSKIAQDGYNAKFEKKSSFASVFRSFTCKLSKASVRMLGGGSLLDRVINLFLK